MLHRVRTGNQMLRAFPYILPLIAVVGLSSCNKPPNFSDAKQDVGLRQAFLENTWRNLGNECAQQITYDHEGRALVMEGVLKEPELLGANNGRMDGLTKLEGIGKKPNIYVLDGAFSEDEKYLGSVVRHEGVHACDSYSGVDGIDLLANQSAFDAAPVWYVVEVRAYGETVAHIPVSERKYENIAFRASARRLLEFYVALSDLMPKYVLPTPVNIVAVETLNGYRPLLREMKGIYGEIYRD